MCQNKVSNNYFIKKIVGSFVQDTGLHCKEEASLEM